MHYIIISLLFLTTTTYSKALCNQSYNAGKYQQALIACEQELSKNSSPELLIKLIEITHELDLGNKLDNYLRQLKNDPKFNDSVEYRYKWNLWQGTIHYNKDNIEQAQKYFMETLSLAIIEKNRRWIAKSYNILGVVANSRKDFKSALNYYNQSLELYKQIGNHYLRGKEYTNIGTVYQHLEEYQKAIEYYRLAINAYEKYKSENALDRKVLKSIKHAFESLLNISLIINDFELAEQYAQRVLIKMEYITTKEKIPSLVNFVALFINKEQYKLAEHFLDEAMALSQIHDNYFASSIYYSYTKLYQEQHLSTKAMTMAQLGIDNVSSSDYINQAKLYLILSELYEEFDVTQSLALLKQYQKTREKLLKQKYDSDIQTIQYHIEKNQIEYELNLTKLERISADLKIKSLNNKFLIMVIVLIILMTGISIFYVTKKREKKYLINKIEHHKQQLIMLDVKHDEEHTVTVNRDVFCAALVETMNEALNIWEKQTKTNRIELADRSRIWTVSNDDGTLRTRSLDKYLSIDKIPKNPRWRNVVRTCHFVLADANINKTNRELLENKLSNILNLFQNLSSNKDH